LLAVQRQQTGTMHDAKIQSDAITLCVHLLSQSQSTPIEIDRSSGESDHGKRGQINGRPMSISGSLRSVVGTKS
jgi:hypothetical protein